jgi:hypothetical protein
LILQASRLATAVEPLAPSGGAGIAGSGSYSALVSARRLVLDGCGLAANLGAGAMLLADSASSASPPSQSYPLLARNSNLNRLAVAPAAGGVVAVLACK